MCVLYRLRTEVPLSREQGGFREGRSTLDQVESLDMVIKASRRRGKKVHLAFLDIKAAYDSVPRSVLWRRCEELGMDYLTLATLRSLFDHNSAQLIVSQKRSAPFALPAGVLQGSVLSPLLYSVYLDPLVDKLRRHGPPIPLPLNANEGINAFLYADDIALIATSSRDLSRLLRLAEEDSIARGYRFSPSKCVVVSQESARHRLYNSDLARQRSFSYLGIEMDHRGINVKAQVQARIEKADKAVERLHLAGARFRNFPCRINLQFYAAFIRPGLEYGLPLLVHEPAAILRLQQCQKRAICRFLGVHDNARNDVVEAISNCPSIQVRQLLLRNRRAAKLALIWNLPTNHDEHALPFVRRGLLGPILTFENDLDISKTPSVLRFEVYVIPVTHSLAERSDGLVSIGLLRWFLRCGVETGIFRTILLWILHRWRIFGPPRRCLYCASLFDAQAHVASCSGLREAIITRCPQSLDLNSLSDSPRLVIEHSSRTPPLHWTKVRSYQLH